MPPLIHQPSAAVPPPPAPSPPPHDFDLRRLEAESFVRAIVFRRRIDSTNNLALQLGVDQQLPTPLLVLAAEQTAGRGRGGNRWWSADGALTFSLLLDRQSVALRPERAHRVSIAAAVAVCEGLEQFVQLPCGIRWPNDVMTAEKKICGILAEVPNSPSSRFVLGIGINLNNSLHAAPPDVQAVGTSLFDLTGSRHDSTEFLLQLLGRLSRVLQAMSADDPVLGEAWSGRCFLRGRTVELEVGPSRVRGLCRGIDADGALVLAAADGPRRLVGGRVVYYSPRAYE